MTVPKREATQRSHSKLPKGQRCRRHQSTAFRRGTIVLLWLRVLPLALASFLWGCGEVPPKDPSAKATRPSAQEVPGSRGELPASHPAAPAKYVGSAACGGCHQAEYQAWLGSHHQRAMQAPKPGTVAGDFSGAVFQQGDRMTEFSQAEGRYLIRTEGPDGRMASHQVRYAFGVAPLQQYLLPLPGGRLQAFGLAWDTAQRRWFDLHPGEGADPDDPLHWTGLGLNWNFMCADCHSTAVVKSYDAEARSYETSFAEVSVSCEACHGPGSIHASRYDTQNPRLDAAVADDGGDSWPGLAALRVPAAQINACAPCHSRRSQLREGFAPDRSYFDHYMPALLDAGLYHADGQILDEVYVYGSFLQSPMHQAGVTCGHCHEPHSAQLRLQGDALCTNCHNEAGRPDFPTLPLGRYDDPKHHLHGRESPGARCVNCHMPARTYMVIDDRRDHSLRIPRPDLQESTSAPDACTGCHQDRNPAWAAEVLQAAFGPPRKDHFGPVFATARDGLPQAEAPLAAIAQNADLPPIVRGTALALLSAYGRGVGSLALEKGLKDTEPLVRIGALRGAERWPPERRWRQARHLLRDELLAVRSEAAPLLAPALNGLPQQDRAALRKGIAEYLEVQEFNADRPEAHTNIGNLHVSLGEAGPAEAAFKTALELNPNWVPALVNLADHYRATGWDAEAGELLQRAANLAADAPEVLLARAFWLVRQKRSKEALPLFAEAYRLAPGNPRYAYAQALALHSIGQSEQALQLLDDALAGRPDNAQLLEAAAGIAKELGAATDENPYLRRLRAL